MTAVIVATGEAPELHGLDEDIPIPLIPLCDRPFLQHIIESLLHLDIHKFEVILSHLPETVESYFGDGVRWGCQIRYHLVAPHRDPRPVVRRIVDSAAEALLLGTADSFPEMSLETLSATCENRPIVFVRRSQDGADAWTGWAVIPEMTAKSAIHPLDAILSPEPGNTLSVETERELSIRSGEEILRSQQQIFEQQFPNIHIGGQQIRPGIWISRGVSLHPAAKLEAPVYIGANCRIGSEVQLGPSAVIGSNSIIGAHSTVINAMVCPGTFIGEALELDHVIVNQHHLVDLKIGTSLAAPEPYLFSSLTDHGLAVRLRCAVDRLFALALLLILGPLSLVAAAVCRGFKTCTCVREEFVSLPGFGVHLDGQHCHLTRLEWNGERAQTRLGRLLFEFTPGLFGVVQGNLSLVGMKARRAAAIEQLPDDWRSLCVKTKTGLITEAEVVFGPNHSEDELYSSEAYYGAIESFGHDLMLLGRYLAGSGVKSTFSIPGECHKQ